MPIFMITPSSPINMETLMLFSLYFAVLSNKLAVGHTFSEHPRQVLGSYYDRMTSLR